MNRDQLIQETSRILGKSTKYMALNTVITELVLHIKKAEEEKDEQ